MKWNQNQFYIYEVPPTDDWSPFQDVVEFLKNYPDRTPHDSIIEMIGELKSTGRWEGDVISSGIAPILSEDPFHEWVLAVKQSNNGDTFFISKAPIPGLTNKCLISSPGKR